MDTKMLTLFKTLCATDWKHRPHHELIILGTGTKEELLKLQDEDVKRWQATDIVIDKEHAAELEESDISKYVPETWERIGGHFEVQRWEMDRKDPQECRKFTGFCEGDSWSIVYHIKSL